MYSFLLVDSLTLNDSRIINIIKMCTHTECNLVSFRKDSRVSSLLTAVVYAIRKLFPLVL
jgi:hypothetical protein